MTGSLLGEIRDQNSPLASSIAAGTLVGFATIFSTRSSFSSAVACLMQLTGWSRYPRHESAVLEPEDFRDVAKLHRSGAGPIARGNGRACGDAAVGFTCTLLTGRLDRMISFDPQTAARAVRFRIRLTEKGCSGLRLMLSPRTPRKINPDLSSPL